MLMSGSREIRDNVPEIADLYIQFRHSRVDLTSAGRFAIDGEMRALRIGFNEPLDNEIRLATGSFEFDFDMTISGSKLHKGVELLSTT